MEKAFLFDGCRRLNGLTGCAVENDEPLRMETLCLHAAQNEYVSLQLAVRGMDEPNGTQPAVTFDSALQNAECEFFFEWFHQCNGKLVPDLLVPLPMLTDFPIKELTAKYYTSEYTVYWIDLFIPKDTAPGVYEGRVTYGTEPDAALPFTVQVFNVELTNQQLLYADMNNYADTVTRHFPVLKNNENRYTDGSYFEAEKAFYRVSHEHRCLFHHLPYHHNGANPISFVPKIAGEGKGMHVTDWSLFDQHFGPYFDGSAFEGTHRGSIPIPFAYLPFCFNWPASYEKWGTEGFRIENRRILLEFIRHFEEKGWTETVLEIFFNHKKRYRFYPYDGDEVRHEHDNEMIYRYDEMLSDLFDQTHVKVLFRTDASWSYGEHYKTRLSKIIKMWTVGWSIQSAYPASFPYMKEQENILWMYTGLSDLTHPMTAMYEYPMRCLQNDIGGFLYWNTTGIGDDFLTCPADNGTVTLYYPAHPFGMETGVLPSVRLKYQRNAMQTADLVKMYEGTWTFHRMRDEIDRVYGIAREEWHNPLPDSWKVPPHELTNEILGNAPRNNPSRNATLDLPERVKEHVLRMASEHVSGRYRWA